MNFTELSQLQRAIKAHNHRTRLAKSAFVPNSAVVCNCEQHWETEECKFSLFYPSWLAFGWISSQKTEISAHMCRFCFENGIKYFFGWTQSKELEATSSLLKMTFQRRLWTPKATLCVAFVFRWIDSKFALQCRNLTEIRMFSPNSQFFTTKTDTKDRKTTQRTSLICSHTRT